MRPLTQYITESARTFDYRVKVAGELTTETYDKFKMLLASFDIASCSKPKKTPIQKNPTGFDNIENEEINIFDVSLNYPANSDQIIEQAKQCGINPNKIVVTTQSFDDSLDTAPEVEDGILETEKYPEPNKEQTQASADYASSYQTAAAEFANEDGASFEIAGEAAPKAKFDTDGKMNTDSPMTKIKRKSVAELLK